jgi:hypothetical protein
MDQTFNRGAMRVFESAVKAAALEGRKIHYQVQIAYGPPVPVTQPDAEGALDTGGFDPVGLDPQGKPVFVSIGFSQKVLQQMVPNQVTLLASEPDPTLRCPPAGKPAAGPFSPPGSPPGIQPQASVDAIVKRAAAAEARKQGLLP